MMFIFQDDILREADKELIEDDGSREAYEDAPDYPGESDTGLEDTNLWVLVGFIIVVLILVSQGVFKKLGGMLSSRATTIQSQLDEARSLREEAQRLLADYQKRQREAETEADDIIAQAKADAKIIAGDARTKLEEQVARRTQSAHDRIARAEAQALADVRAQTADLAVDAAREIIKARTDGSAQKAILDRSITELRGKLN
jgi:F-type H+-transporting ATPase subunit b